MRVIFASILIAVSLYGSELALSQEPPKQSPEVNTEQQPNRTQEPQRNTQQQAKPANEVSPAPSEHPPEDTKRHAENEAEKRAEEASEYGVFLGHRLKITDALLAVFTFLLVVVGIGQGIFLYRTDQGTHKAANAAKESADSARDAAKAAIASNEFSNRVFETTQRPWASIATEQITGSLVIAGNNVYIHASLTLQNTGSQPAMRVIVRSKLYVPGYGGAMPFDVRARFLEEIDKTPADAFLGHVLFPGDKFTDEVQFGFHEGANWIQDGRPGAVFIIAAVTYRSGTSGTPHHTATIFILERQTENGWVNVIDPKDGSVPAAHLRLRRHSMGTLAN